MDLGSTGIGLIGSSASFLTVVYSNFTNIRGAGQILAATAMSVSFSTFSGISQTLPLFPSAATYLFQNVFTSLSTNQVIGNAQTLFIDSCVFSSLAISTNIVQGSGNITITNSTFADISGNSVPLQTTSGYVTIINPTFTNVTAGNGFCTTQLGTTLTGSTFSLIPSASYLFRATAFITVTSCSFNSVSANGDSVFTSSSGRVTIQSSSFSSVRTSSWFAFCWTGGFGVQSSSFAHITTVGGFLGGNNAPSSVQSSTFFNVTTSSGTMYSSTGLSIVDTTVDTTSSA